MCEFDSLDRCAAFVATRDSLAAIHRAARSWPAEIAGTARHAATRTMMTTAEGVRCDPSSANRRRCLRDALGTAIEVAATCDLAVAMGVSDDDLEAARRQSGRAIALLALFFHANTAPLD